MERVQNKDQILDRLAGAIDVMLTNEGEHQYQRGVTRGRLDQKREASEKYDALIGALKKITRIPNGPDRGSAQFQINCAVLYARQALGEKPPQEGNKEDLYI